jgi:hypothetical protein
MKITVFITMLVFVGVILFVMTQMVNEAETNYGISINKSVWTNESNQETGNKYDFALTINDSISPMAQDFLTLANEDEGWLTRISSGFTGIVRAVIFLPLIVFQAGMLGGVLITGLGTSLGLPSYLTLVFIILLYTWGAFKLVEFFQRWQV